MSFPIFCFPSHDPFCFNIHEGPGAGGDVALSLAGMRGAQWKEEHFSQKAEIESVGGLRESFRDTKILLFWKHKKLDIMK